VNGKSMHVVIAWHYYRDSCYVPLQVREEASEGEGPPRRVLGLHHTRTVKMPEDVLAVRITPDGRLLALALLDSTVQVSIASLPCTLRTPPPHP